MNPNLRMVKEIQLKKCKRATTGSQNSSVCFPSFFTPRMVYVQLGGAAVM